jgi:hypothetical protein
MPVWQAGNNWSPKSCEIAYLFMVKSPAFVELSAPRAQSAELIEPAPNTSSGHVSLDAAVPGFGSSGSADCFVCFRMINGPVLLGLNFSHPDPKPS